MDLPKPPTYSLPYLYYRRARAFGTMAYGAFMVIPSEIIGNAIPALRPDPKVSRTRTVWIDCVRWVSAFTGTYRDVFIALPPRKIEQSRLDELGVRHEEAPAWKGELKGEIKEAAERRGVKSADVSLYWSDTSARKEGLERRDARLLMSFHGGAYGNSGSPDDPTSWAPTTVSKLSKTIDVCCTVDYRLSNFPVGAKEPVNPFPAALIDGLTAVKHALSLGYQAENIYLFGDSAGANLALGLCRYLLYEEDTRLGGLVLLSPWTDISGSHSKPGLSRINNRKTDYLGDDLKPGSYVFSAVLGPSENMTSPESPYISPASQNIPSPTFERFPRTFINAGGNEQLLDEIKTLHARMGKYLSSNDLHLNITEHTPHNFQVFSMYEPERTEVMQRIADWIDAAPR